MVTKLVSETCSRARPIRLIAYAFGLKSAFKIMMKVFILSLLLFASLGHAQECKNIDLREQFPEVQNQYSSPTCYAFTAAEWVSFHIGKRVSASYILSFYNTLWFSWLMDPFTRADQRNGGNPVSAINALSDIGFCPESIMRSDLNGLSLELAFDHIVKFASNIRQKKSSKPQQLLSVKNDDVLNKMFPLSSPETLLTIILNSSDGDVIAKLATNVCSGSLLKTINPLEIADDLVVPYKRAFGWHEAPQERLISTVLNEVSSGNPVMLGINMDILINGSPSTSHMPDHAVFAIGSRWDNEKHGCRILLRNSWGKRCDVYSNNIQCEPETGYIWILASDLKRDLYRINYLKNK